MPSPEGREPLLNMSPAERLAASGLAFLVAVALAAPAPTSSEESKASLREIDAADIAKCKKEYPPQTGTLTMDDYLGIDRWGGGLHRQFSYERKESLFQRVLWRSRVAELQAYNTNPERTQRIEAHVNRFAAGMVERANSGDPTYRFYTGSASFLDGVIQDDFEPVPDDYEGFGWLERDVRNKGGKIVQQEIADNIYRHSDGSYYKHPKPFTLSVYNEAAESNFEAPEVLGYGPCSTVSGNGATVGWRVSHYDFRHLYERGFHTIQSEPWAYGNTTVTDVQLADRRADHFIENRYNPDVQQGAR